MRKIIISGFVSLSSRRKRYKGKKERNRLIQYWKKLYASEKNNKNHFIIIEPDIPETKVIEKGEVVIYNENMQFFDSSNYISISQREKIVKDWIKKYNLEKYFLEITPYI